MYSSRRQADEFVKHVREKGSFGDSISFGQRADPCVGIFSKVMSCFRALDEGSEARKSDNLNVAVVPAVDVPGLRNSDDPSSSSSSTESPAGRSPGGGGSNGSSKLWTTSDMAALRAVDPATLAPLGPLAVQSDLHPSLRGGLSCAHPQRCPRTGDVFNYNLRAGGPRPTYRVFRVRAATGRTDVLASISRPSLPMAYVHSLFLSGRFVALRVPSSHLGAMGLAVPWRGNLAEALAPWDPARRCRWFVVDRVHGRGVVAEFETPAAFFFHSVNCWDELVPPGGVGGGGGEAGGGEGGGLADVFFDVVDFPTMDIIHKHYYDVLMNRDGEAQKWYADEARTRNCLDCSLVRWRVRVPLPTASPRGRGGDKPSSRALADPEVVFKIPSPHAGEMPTINPRFHTRPSRYVYSLPQTGRSTFVDTIVKTDTLTREVLQWDNPAGHTPGEAIFVPRPDCEDEDDGVLLSVILDGHSEKSYLLCLDARTMEELGRAEMDFVVGFDLHGMHSPRQDF